jgi:hypothetical protein
MPDAPRKKNLSEVLQLVQSVMTISAIIVGGFWTYLLFVQQRQRYAHLKIEHNVTHFPLPDHRILLILDITHMNVGSARVLLRSADIRVYNLNPGELTDDLLGLINEGALPPDGVEWTEL